ncbi:MAG: hypothetical protein KAS70_00190 [Planctomycetes bacterium]|nr:hypothetical protein [Planctomycetota bacterium]
MTENLVVVSKVKKVAKEQGMRTGADAIEKLSQIIEAKIASGIEKARASGKKTIQAIDLE